jgi:short-subunit dehydrogenase
MTKKVLITGAGSGLGRSMAEFCAARGDRVLVADIDLPRAQETVALLKSAGHLAHAIDVTDSEQWTKLAELARREFGQFDLLINNAGVASSGEFLETTDTEWDRVIAVNQTAVHKGCRTLLPLMLGRTEGRAAIINVASFAGIAAAPDTGVYGVSKAAVVAYSEILRAQLANQRVHVACLCPSFFATNLLQSFTPGHDRMRKAAERFMATSALSAADVARFAIEQAEAGVFMLLPHKETRSKAWIKRYFPEFYFRQLVKKFRPAR